MSQVCVEIGRVASALDALGCTDDEVDRVSSVQGRVLPMSYRCFLKAMGRDVGGCFDCLFVSYPYVLELRAAAVDLLRANSENHRDVFSLPEDAIVISMIDQGYAFMFIRSSMGDDAPVERWSEGPERARAEVVFSSVLDWIQSAYKYATTPNREASRRRLQRRLRQAFDPPSCPVCGADWSSYDEVHVLQDLTYMNMDNATLISCRNCLRRFHWWWGQLARPVGG